MDLFWEAAKAADSSVAPKTQHYHEKLFLLVSDNYRDVFQHRLRKSPPEVPEMYVRLQLVTDQVAGMTDAYACRLHKELLNAN
jgi:dGTP triphosphohydrolase